MRVLLEARGGPPEGLPAAAAAMIAAVRGWGRPGRGPRALRAALDAAARP